jgi:hypothetical protein
MVTMDTHTKKVLMISVGQSNPATYQKLMVIYGIMRKNGNQLVTVNHVRTTLSQTLNCARALLFLMMEVEILYPAGSMTGVSATTFWNTKVKSLNVRINAYST